MPGGRKGRSETVWRERSSKAWRETSEKDPGMIFQSHLALPQTKRKANKILPTKAWVTINYYLQPILGNSGEMTDGCLEVEPGDVVLEGGDDGDEGDEDNANVDARSQSSCVVPGWGK